MCALWGAGGMGGESAAQPPSGTKCEGELQKGDVPQGRVLQETEVESTKLGSRPKFPPAFPPHKCALDPNSDVPMK